MKHYGQGSLQKKLIWACGPKEIESTVASEAWKLERQLEQQAESGTGTKGHELGVERSLQGLLSSSKDPLKQLISPTDGKPSMQMQRTMEDIPFKPSHPPEILGTV